MANGVGCCSAAVVASLDCFIGRSHFTSLDNSLVTFVVVVAVAVLALRKPNTAFGALLLSIATLSAAVVVVRARRQLLFRACNMPLSL